MSVSKQILFSGFTNNRINIPINLDWEYLDVDSEIKEYETSILNELITTDKDFIFMRELRYLTHQIGK